MALARDPRPTQSTLSIPDLRVVLQQQLATRCARNARYSLRAFARSLGMDHSTLSQLLRGKRIMTVRMIERICARLEVPTEQRRQFIAGQRLRRRLTDDGGEQVRRLGRDVSLLASDWRHFAILQLTRLESFRPDSRWIARVLDLSVDSVNIAVQRLLRFGLLRMSGQGSWEPCPSNSAIMHEDVANAAAARCAAELQPIADAVRDGRPRDRSVHTIAVATRRVDEAIEIMERCRKQVLATLSADPADDVYRLEFGLGPATTNKP